MRNKKVLCLAESAVMVALAFGLSYAKLFEMPLGGSITLCSMLPIMLIAIKYGPLVGLSCGFIYSGTQILQGFGSIFTVGYTGGVVAVMLIFDYVLPFTLLGLAGIFGKKNRWTPIAGMCFSAGLRLICHYISGVTIWAQWAPFNSWLYSLLYNGGFLLPDLALTVAAAILLLSDKGFRGRLDIGK